MRNILTVILLTILPASKAFAWGPEGHRIIGDIARDHLTATAKRNIQALLGNDDLAGISNWADEVRSQRPETYGWHFVDIPKSSAGFSEVRDCYRPDGKVPASLTDRHNCVVDRVTLFKQILADRNSPQPDRLEALKFLVHFVGDVHQPMHAIERARGGNDIHVVAFGSAQCGDRPCNLHYEWDIGLIDRTGRSEAEYVSYLERMIGSKRLRAGGTPEDWANESFRLAKQAWVNDGGAVDDAYYRANMGIIDERLAIAGLRLAAVLNDALAAPGKISGVYDENAEPRCLAALAIFFRSSTKRLSSSRRVSSSGARNIEEG